MEATSGERVLCRASTMERIVQIQRIREMEIGTGVRLTMSNYVLLNIY